MDFNKNTIPKSQKKANEILEKSLKKIIIEKQKELPFSLSTNDLNNLLPHGKTKIYEMLNKKIIPSKKVGGKWIIPRDLFLYWYYTSYENINYEKILNI